MRPNIYISVPVTIDWTEVKKVVNRLASAGVSLDITYWNRQEKYSPSLVDNCDIFAFMHQSNCWKFNEGSLPSGVDRELQRAKSLGKSIYMIYINTEGQYNFYHIEILNNVIQGIPGSTAFIWGDIENLIKTCNTSYNKDEFAQISTSSECVDYDSRLLL